jgi:hypothetical protein
MTKKLLYTLTALLVFTACTQDAYEKGEGKYSLLQADFVEAHTQADKAIDYLLTDDGDRLDIALPIKKSWANTPDSFYRSVCYYKIGADQSVEVTSLTQINVIDSIIPTDSLKKGMKSDPLTLESLWVSKSKRFLNAGIYLKTGTTDNSQAAHLLGLVHDTLITHANGKRTLCARLYHDQGGMPEYYSQRTFLSILLTGLPADSVQLSVNTYKGWLVKCLPIQ